MNSWDNSVNVNIAIEASTEYILSTNSNNYYQFGVPAETFPFVNESITLLNYQFQQGPPQTFPDVSIRDER